MKITFLGLSCFLIENSDGGKILLDPYYDEPRFSFGLHIPEDTKAHLFLASHPDEDHSQLPSKWTIKPNDTTHDFLSFFPDLTIKGTLVKEFAGDLNIAYSFTVDGKRLLHLADNAHVLTPNQLDEIGIVDIVFMSPPKVPEHTYHIENIHNLKPAAVILSHHIPPLIEIEEPARDEVEQSLRSIIIQDWITNSHATEKTVTVMTDMFFESLRLRDEFELHQIFAHDLEINVNEEVQTPQLYFFRKCKQ